MRASGIEQADPRYQALLRLLKQNASGASTSGPLTPKHYPGSTADQHVDSSQSNLSVSQLEYPNSAYETGAKLKGPFTLEQLQQLRAQILAFKYLSRNIPLPLVLLNAIKGENKGTQVKKELSDVPPSYPAQQTPPLEDRLSKTQSQPGVTVPKHAPPKSIKLSQQPQPSLSAPSKPTIMVLFPSF